MKRLRSRIPVIDTLVELLVGLQLDESLSSASAPAPAWAKGTSVEEIFRALRVLGDGEWLAGLYDDRGIYESADQWLSDYFQGAEVPTPDDARIGVKNIHDPR